VRRVVVVPLTIAAAAGLVVPVAARTAPLREAGTQVGLLALVDEACSVVGDSAVVVLAHDEAALYLSHSVRMWCGVPVAVAGPRRQRPVALAALARDWAAAGRAMVVLSSSDAVLDLAVPGATPVRVGPVVDDRRPELTVESSPSAYVSVRTVYSVAVVDPRG
jgi:hypothetical protein